MRPISILAVTAVACLSLMLDPQVNGQSTAYRDRLSGSTSSGSFRQPPAAADVPNDPNAVVNRFLDLNQKIVVVETIEELQANAERLDRMIDQLNVMKRIERMVAGRDGGSGPKPDTKWKRSSPRD